MGLQTIIDFSKFNNKAKIKYIFNIFINKLFIKFFI